MLTLCFCSCCACCDLLQATVMDAVVKIFCVHTEPNYSLPWQRKRQFASTSSGFMVEGDNGERFVLTNAHSVEYFSQVGCVWGKCVRCLCVWLGWGGVGVRDRWMSGCRGAEEEQPCHSHACPLFS